MPTYKAEWILPIADAPIRDGWVAVEEGRIAGLGQGFRSSATDLGRAVILPALVNAHTHIELSFLRGCIPPSRQFIDWVGGLMEARRAFSDAADPRIVESARSALSQARDTGTGVIGDVSNSLITLPLFEPAGMLAHVFYELTGFNVDDPDGRVRAAREKASAAIAGYKRVRVSLAPHAPYSVSPELFSAIRADLDAHEGAVSTVHLGESAEEVEFVRSGTGAPRRLLESLGVWNPRWQPPGVSPVAYLSDLGFLDRRVLVVHGVQFGGEDLARLRALGVTLVSCPRSNVYVGVGSPPLDVFYAMDVDVAFGTDSLASSPDLNMFSELAEARRIAPHVPARRLLESGTINGARALGFADEAGSIEIGKGAALIAVRVPTGVHDVEEYLVSGIEPGAISWLGERADASRSVMPAERLAESQGT